MVRSKPDDFYALGCAKESRESLLQNARWQEILNAIDDLRQLLQPEYPQVIRETALQLKWDIADICQRPVKFVVLGSGCAGKTTFVESLSSVINQQSGRSSYIASIWECLIRGLEDVWSLNSKPNTYIHIWSPQPAITGEFQPDPWRDGAFSLRYLSVITRMSQWLQDIQFEFPPHYRYYLTPDSLARMFSRDYRPSKKDILSLSIRTTGIHQHVFPKFVLTDTGGQRSERKKWIHAFPRAYAVVFVASLCGDEEELLEAADVDSMAESLAIWQAILSAPRFFRSTDFILVLTKADILLDRAQRDGGDSLEKRIKTIMDQYIGVWNVETTRRGLNRSLHTHVVDQMQTTDIKAVLNTLEGVFLF
ncbi:G-protein alpha subunit-domain-containing protein [Mycena floridula]|nr:G-protein alpha subunit-domain-containing protein [Mycena floridula]